MYFWQIQNFAYGEINERSFSNPHSWTNKGRHCIKTLLSHRYNSDLENAIMAPGWVPNAPCNPGGHYRDYYPHDDVIKIWNIFRVTSPLTSGSPFTKGQWRRVLIFSLIRALTNGWANNRDADNNLKPHCALIVSHCIVLINFYWDEVPITHLAIWHLQI